VLQDQAVATAREVIASDFWMAWAAPLIRWLRERSPGLALDWVFGITHNLLPRTGSLHATELLNDLEQLSRWRQSPPSSEVFRQKAEDLWYRPGRDIVCTAMNRLCFSLAEFVCPDLEIGINWLWFVPYLLCQDGFDGRPRQDLVEWCLADFASFTARFTSQNAGGDAPVCYPDAKPPTALAHL
jgi:hypothetical protein